MKKHVISFFMALGIVAFSTIHLSGVASAQQGVVIDEAAEIVAEVISIDRENRMVTLKGESGKVEEIKFPEEMRNFDRIEVGDVLEASYFKSVVLSLGEPGSTPEANAKAVAAQAEEGEKPAEIVMETSNLSAKVLAIDKEKRTVTLEKPDGTSVTLNVDPSIEGFDTVKVGDTINASVTKSIAISVEKQNR